MSRIDECIEQYRDWCAKLGIVTISDLNQMITRGEVNRLINLSEIWQEQKISEIAKDIKDNIEKRKIILISGPSSSGKTSFANRLSLHLKVLGIGSLALSLDDYYLPAELIPSNEKGEKDLETIEAIDYAHFNRDIESLITGRETDLPIFDFITARPSDRVKRVSLCENEVIIVEGIHGLNPKLLSNISDENKYKIYCSALTALRRDDMTKINSRTTRLIRRIIRDHFFRGTSAKDTLLRWRSVEEGAAKHIFPYTDNADIIFNSSLLYEHCVYKIYLNELLFGMTDGTSGYETVQELSDLINRFKLIDRDMVPRTSLVREFVGGSTLIE
ncbi:MAG: nucleoside kinase [Ruminococcaceae bacterium]|nr:nucleoside kinase [Oscillospiraceae bacterium]